MRRTEALASVKFYQILSIFIFFIRLIILEDFIRLISYNGPCVRLGCSFFLATALLVFHSYFCSEDYTVEPRYNKPLYDKFVGITNQFLYHSDSNSLLTRTLKYRSLLTENKFCQSLGSSIYRGSTVTPKLRAGPPAFL